MNRAPLALLALAGIAASAPSGQQLRLTPAEIAVRPTVGAIAGTSGVPGTTTTVLAGDPAASGPYTIMLRVPASTRIAAHRHRDERSAVVIAGDWSFGFGAVASDAALKALPPGSFYTEPANVLHFARTGAKGATVYITGIGPTDTVYASEPPLP